LAWLLVIVAAIKLYWPRLARSGEAPPFANSDWYTVIQGALWLAFLFMLIQSVLVSIDRGTLTSLETAAIVCFAIGFAVTCVGFPITLIRWRRAKRAMRAP
jgi:amino acid transporter